MADENEQLLQLQLELPNYEQKYAEWLEKQDKNKQDADTVIVIDIY